ncbi:CobW family GTP-binding protein [Peteryoungia ipomoeae]|uniref:GTP-binding protein n=1 Tax=Peteryoungia ipomoeae TaxID=1210932 RepID=A0A4S8NY58_9HYPH|nr:GTP-binding protein [Peteryoungia ipomoeae]THV22448.1 GTP-binding protein [Peteryoungia ipomoeae]
MASSRIPVSILTGFLGAGKSTLLNRLLKDPAMRDAAVIINEFGEVGIDHLLVETSNDAVLELADGCLCCTVRGELVDTLAELVDGMQTGRIKPLSRVVIETTGLADPAPVMQSVMGHPAIAQHFELEGVITLVDVVHGLATIDAHPEAYRQVAVADRLVLTKKTLAKDDAIALLVERLRAINPHAAVTDGDAPEAGNAGLLVNGLYDPSTKIADVDRWLHADAHQDHDHHDHGHDGHHGHGHHHHHHHHDVNRHGASIRSFSIVHDTPIEPSAIAMFVDLLRSTHGEKLLRMKAVIATTDAPDRPLVLHGVQSIFHPPMRLPSWPEGSDRKTRLVLITQGLDEAYVRELFDAFSGKVMIDRADRQAMTENPLAVPGFRF